MARVVGLLAGAGGEPGVVERPGPLGGISAIELDLDAEDLVGISDYVLALVLVADRCASQLHEPLVQLVVGDQRAIALRYRLALSAQELLPTRSQPSGPMLRWRRSSPALSRPPVGRRRVAKHAVRR